MARVKIYFDGGCRPNPGAMELAVVAGGQAHVLRALGHGTSMDAEWLALIHALRVAQEIGAADAVLLGDSVAVIGQANGTVKCRGATREHLEALRALAGEAGMPRIRYIKRSQNLAGIALARLHAG